MLAGLFAEVLQVDINGIGINDGFFELGGHSLRAAVLVSRIHREFRVKLPLTDIFRTPRLCDLAGLIKYEQSVVAGRCDAEQWVHETIRHGFKAHCERAHCDIRRDRISQLRACRTLTFRFG